MVPIVRNNVKPIACALLVGIFLGFTSMMAYATTTYSSWKYYGPVYGYSYKNRAEASNGSNYYVCARAVAANSTSSDVPAGYLGSRPSMYKSDGQLMWTGSWYYNSIPANSISVPVDATSIVSIYSKGMTAAYNGDGYSTYSTYQSPVVNPYLLREGFKWV